MVTKKEQEQLSLKFLPGSKVISKLTSAFTLPAFLTLSIILFPLVASPLKAQNKPVYYQVAELAEGDHLNVRAYPDAKSEDIGDIESDSKPWEILETDPTGQWGRIIWLEGSGWVSLRFMQPVQIEHLADTQIPVGLTCVGAEPFWTMEIKSQQIGVISTSEAIKPMTVVNTTTSRNSKHFPIAVDLQSESYTAIATLRRSQCSDGMGDLRYGWAADIIINPQFTLLSGCCELR